MVKLRSSSSLHALLLFLSAGTFLTFTFGNDTSGDINSGNQTDFSTAGTDLGSNWRSLDWFGYYHPTSAGWLYHMDHGWIYPVATSFESVWFYSPTHGWLWTTQSAYPWTWFHTGQGWKYYLTAKANWYNPNNSSETDGTTELASPPPSSYTVQSTGMEMIWCPSGTFIMGSPTSEVGRAIYQKYVTGGSMHGGDETQHQVSLTRGFYLGKFELSEKEYKSLVSSHTSYFSGTNLPLEGVDWLAAKTYCEQLTQLEQSSLPSGWAFALPTEAEWEYACRAGTTTPYSWGSSVNSSQANYINTGLARPIAVDSFSPNPWGFHNMQGNVWEWVADWYGNYEGSVTDPQGPTNGEYRVNRGGSFINESSDIRSAYREADPPSRVMNDVGFRVALKPVLDNADPWPANNQTTIDGSGQKNDSTSEKNPSDDVGSGAVDSNTTQISIFSDLFDYSEIIDLKTMFPYQNIRNFSITDMGYSSNSMKAQAEMEFFSVWANVDIEFTRPEGTATLATAVDLDKNGIPDFFDWPQSYMISVDGNVKVNWNAFNYYGNSMPLGSATYGLENSNLTRKSDSFDSTITRAISLKSTTLASFYKSYLPNGRIDAFTPKPVKASGGIALDLTQGNYTSEVTVSGDGVKTTTKLKGNGTVSMQGDQLTLSDVPLPSMANAELGKIHSFMADESVLENVILTKHDEVYSGYVTKNQVHYWIEVSNSESDSQTQDSNNSDNNSSSSNNGPTSNNTSQPNTRTISSASNLEMIWVEPGTFTMGSPTTESGRSSNETQHQVTLTQGFYLGKYEVTQAQYEAVMTGNSDGLSATPSNYSNNPNRPVEKVSWNDIQVFLTRLNQGDSTNIPAGWAYVLPTEAQWEYACRAGTTTAYSWGNSISSSNANYNRNIGETQDVGQYSPNAWGFFDMHGNVWEWTADRYSSSYYGSNAVTDPTGPASGSDRVNRGGSWINVGTNLRSARRYDSNPSHRYDHIGFRVGFQKVQ